MKRTLSLILFIVLVTPNKYIELFEKANDTFFQTEKAVKFMVKMNKQYNLIEDNYKQIKKNNEKLYKLL